MKTRKILVATDMSASSAFAAKWAHNYAQTANVEVALVNIIELSVPNWLRDQYNIEEDDGKLSKMKATLTEWYNTHTEGEPDEIIIRVGNVQDMLERLVEDEDASMLVLARSGKSALTKFLAGSTAQMMAANPPCTVVIVHPDHTALDNNTKIAVATDLTESAEKALTVSAVMADVLGTSLDIVHASAVNASVDMEDLELLDNSDQSLIDLTQKQIDSVLAKHADKLDRVDYQTHIIHESPVDAMEQFVNAHKPDMVFVGNAASYNIVTNIFGRVSVKLTQLLSSTVVVVPPQVSIFGGDEEE